MDQKWTMRSYRDGDEDRILELSKAVHPARQFNREKWLRWWRWKYQENPAGNALMWLAENKGDIVGQYAIVPVKMKVGNKIVLAAQSVDTMTHPNYRRQKIFETLARKVYEDATNHNILFVYGFPNQFSHPGFVNKLNWFDVQQVQIMFKPFKWNKVLALKIRNRFLRIILATGADLIFNKAFSQMQKTPIIKKLVIKRITSFDERFDEFWNSICDMSNMMVVKGKNYLNWRYSTPDMKYFIFAAEKDQQICGYIVLRQKITDGVQTSSIFDLMAQSKEIMHCLVSRAIEESNLNGVDVILYPSITDKTYHGILKRNGFISQPFIKSGYFSIYNNSPSVSRASLCNPKNWLVQLGDSDAV